MFDQFAHPGYLYALALVPVAALLMWGYWRWRQKKLQALGENLKRQWLAAGKGYGVQQGALLLALALMLVALANPQKGMERRRVAVKSSDLVFVLDVSQSMWCKDVSPNRLELAKLFIQKTLQATPGNRVGLVLFAGDAFAQVPLTEDYNYLLERLRDAEPQTMSQQGSDISLALETAVLSFDPEPNASRAIILLSDGENHESDPEDAAENAYDKGIVVFTVSVGTEGGGVLPVAANVMQPRRDDRGEAIRSKADEALLNATAAAGGGKLFRSAAGDAATEALVAEIKSLPQRAVTMRSFTDAASYYQWFLAPALLLLVLGQWFTAWVRRKKAPEKSSPI